MLTGLGVTSSLTQEGSFAYLTPKIRDVSCLWPAGQKARLSTASVFYIALTGTHTLLTEEDALLYDACQGVRRA
jgi:hypothetical protein